MVRDPLRGGPIPGLIFQVLVILLEEAEDILEVAAAAVLDWYGHQLLQLAVIEQRGNS